MFRLKLLLAIAGTFCLMARAQQLQPRADYRLHGGDQLTIEYTYTSEFNTTVFVQPDGFVTPKVGKQVAVAGKTIAQAKALLEQSASERLIKPVVTLTLLDFQHPYFVVAGEAFAPAKYDMRENLTVLQGLMLAGGIKQTGKEKQVVLIHGLNTSEPQVHLLDLKKVNSPKIFEQDMALSAGDIIFIPRNKLTHAIQVFSLITSPAIYANIAAYTLR